MYEIPNILEPKEKVIYHSKPKYAPYIVRAIFGSILFGLFLGWFTGSYFESLYAGLIGGFLVFIISLSISQLAYIRIHYAITNKRVIFQSGIIGRDFKSIDYDRMQNVSVDVGLLGVIFKVGDVKIYTGELESAGKNGGVRPKYDRFNYVESPYSVLKELQTHLSKRKEYLR